MSRRIVALLAFVLLALSVTAYADTLVLKDGRVLQGTFKGATDTMIKLEVDGKIQEIALADITTLTFSPRAATTETAKPVGAATAGATTAGGAAATTAPAKASPGTIPAGTKLMLKTTDAIGTASHRKGAKVTAALDNDIAVDGKVILPKGTVVYGTVTESRGGRVVGGSALVMTFTQVSVNNQLIAITTDQIGAQTEPGGTAKKVGAGALIGAAAGDAGAGAAVGGAVALLAAKGNHLAIPPGSLAEVTLTQPVTIP
jgi:hypothetical protein